MNFGKLHSWILALSTLVITVNFFVQGQVIGDDGDDVMPGSSEPAVIELNSENFEHLTQAATGATTGDWLVEFFAPWCGHCQQFAPVYEDIGKKLKGRVNVAKVDMSANPSVGKRFSIRRLPTIIMLSQGKLYKFSGSRNAESVMKFATEEFKKADAEEVPAAPSIMDDLIQHAHHFHRQLMSMMQGNETALPLVAVTGCLVCLVMFCMCCGGKSNKTKSE